LLPLFLLIFAATLWSVYWFIAVDIAKDRFTREKNNLSSRGFLLGCNSETWGGFPFRFEFTCASPIMRFEDRLEIKSANVLAVVLAYNPRQVVLLIDGPSAVSGITPLPLIVGHRRAVASITIGKDNQPILAADLPQLVIDGLLAADRVRYDSRVAVDGRIEVAASVNKLNYRPEGRPEFPVARGELHGFLSGERTFDVESIVLTQGSVRYWGKGEVRLDAHNRIAGKLSTETNDLDGLMTVLEPHLNLTADQKTSLRAVLGLIGNESRADMTASDGQLFIGPFKIADLIPLY
jgi:hypothetical protein